MRAIEARTVDAKGANLHTRARGRGHEGRVVVAGQAAWARVCGDCARSHCQWAWLWGKRRREGGDTGAAIVDEFGTSAVDGRGEFSARAVAGVGVCLYRGVEALAGGVGVEMDDGGGGDGDGEDVVG